MESAKISAKEKEIVNVKYKPKSNCKKFTYIRNYHFIKLGSIKPQIQCIQSALSHVLLIVTETFEYIGQKTL